jgi:hypothetical protein
MPHQPPLLWFLRQLGPLEDLPLIHIGEMATHVVSNIGDVPVYYCMIKISSAYSEGQNCCNVMDFWIDWAVSQEIKFIKS